MFALLVAASWTIPGFVPAYYPHALASGLRNAHFGWRDHGVFYFGIVAVGFLVEAVAVVGAPARPAVPPGPGRGSRRLTRR